MLTVTLIWWQQCRLCVVISSSDMKVWLGKVCPPGHRKLLCCALKSTSERKRWEEEIASMREGILWSKGSCCLYVAAMNVNCVCMWSVVYSCRRFCWKTFLKCEQTEWNRDKHTWICPIEVLVWNYWTKYYTLDQLDAGKSVQGDNECLSPWLLNFFSTCAPTL